MQVCETYFEKFVRNLVPDQRFGSDFLKLMSEALTHPSYDSTKNYEKLETIGDAALDLIVSEWFYTKQAESPKQISEGRSSVVCNKTLAKVAKSMKLKRYLRVAKGHRILNKDLADTLEAVIGAIKLAFGFGYCEEWVITHMKDNFEKALKEEQENPNKWGRSENNFVNMLQEFTQSKFGTLPNYYGIPTNRKNEFTIVCQVRDQSGVKYSASVTARSKKEARKLVAQKVCETYKLL